MVTETLIDVRRVSKIYRRGSETLHVLQDYDLQVAKGEFLALMGPSGCGKSTLLNLMGALDEPDSGAITFAGEDILDLTDSERSAWRARNVGFIFQAYNLVPVLTAFQNVMLPLLLTPLSRARRKEQAQLALNIVGMGDRMSHYPNQLSGGQEQRVAIARAIATDPRVLLADEPTGDLDATNAAAVLDILQSLNKQNGLTIIMVTHDPSAATRAHRTVHLDKVSVPGAVAR
ncbi:MAG TPA: ABC transporter ATP-binding protein [Planctomycetota bacterium]|jgi:putative ABC transport system ATP-binding protein|nr:ABC transporter ATP-binding protein [Planctomycetota bacterium]